MTESDTQQVEELKRELAECKAQMEASTIYADQANQAMERKYQVLVEKHSVLVSEKEKTATENSQLRKEIGEARQEAHRLKTEAMKAEAEKERQQLELEALGRDKLGLSKLLDDTRVQIEELQSRLKASSDKIMSLTKANGDLDAKLQSALMEKSRLGMTHTKLEQEKKILEKSNTWLTEELEKKSDSSNEERQKTTQKIVEIQNKYYECNSKLEQLSTEHSRLLEQVKEQEKMLKATSLNLKEAREEIASKEESFEKEIALAQRMAQLYKENSEEHSKRAAELEGIVSELKRHMEDSALTHSNELKKLEEARMEAQKKLEEERELRQRVIDAAASASMTIVTPGPGEIPSSHEGAQDVSTPSELYAKLIEAQERLRTEQLKNKEKEIYMEEVLVEVEKRASLLQEQQAEYETMKTSHNRLLQDIENLASEKRRLQNNIKNLESRIKTTEREKRSLEVQVKDLGQQVSRLLHESTSRVAKASSDFSGGTASDLTTELLVEFSSIEELQQQNQRLLRVNRELSEAAEATKLEAQQELREEYEDQLESLRNDIEDLRKSRQNAEEVLDQVVHQRDTLRKLLQGTNGDSNIGKQQYARSPSEKVDMNEDTDGHGAGALEVEDGQYKQLFENLEDEFQQYKEKSNSSYAMLEKELAEAKNDLIVAKRETAHSQAQAEFERERANRLSNSLDSQQKHLESLLSSNAHYQALINETERRLAAAQLQVEKAEEKMRSQGMRLDALEAEKRLLADMEKRLSKENGDLSQEKFRIAAELDVKQKHYADLEASYAKDVSDLQRKASMAVNELYDAQRELAVTKLRAENAIKEVQYIREDTSKSITKLEEKLQENQNELSKAQQRATSAESKADLLQEAVRKAEETIARLEIEKNARLSQHQLSERNMESRPADAAEANIDTQVQELTAEIKILREELSSAQQAAAASTGHAKQFKTLAETAEEAMKSVQIEHEKFKKESASRICSMEVETLKLRTDLEEKEKALETAKEVERQLHLECEKLKEAVENEKSSVNSQLEQVNKHWDQEKEKVTRLTEDIESLRKHIEEVKKSYDAEVLAHGDALRRVSGAESMLESVQNRLNSVSEDLEKERSSRKQSEEEHKAKIETLTNQNNELTRKVSILSSQRDTLQAELEKMAAAQDGASDFSNTLRMLRQEREAAEINLQLTERELNRVRQELLVVKRSAEEARLELASEIERYAQEKAEKRDVTSDHAEQISILRESNVALRSDNVQKQQQLDEMRKRLQQSEKQVQELQKQSKEKDAVLESVRAEVIAAKETAERWERRASALSDKPESVDASEYQQVQEKLSSAQKELQNAQESHQRIVKEKDSLQRRIKELENWKELANTRIKQLAKQNESDTKEATEWRKEKAELGAKIKSLEGSMLELQSQNQDNLTKLSESHSKEEDLKKNLQRSLMNFKKALQQRKTCEKELEAVKEQVKSLENQLTSYKEAALTPVMQTNMEAKEGLKRKSAEVDVEDEDLQTKKLRPTAPVFAPSTSAPESPAAATTGQKGSIAEVVEPKQIQDTAEDEKAEEEPKEGQAPSEASPPKQPENEETREPEAKLQEREDKVLEARDDMKRVENAFAGQKDVEDAEMSDVEAEVQQEKEEPSVEDAEPMEEEAENEENEDMGEQVQADVSASVEKAEQEEEQGEHEVQAGEENEPLASGTTDQNKGDASKGSKGKRTKIEWKDTQAPVAKPSQQAAKPAATKVVQTQRPAQRIPGSSTPGVNRQGKTMIASILQGRPEGQRKIKSGQEGKEEQEEKGENDEQK